MGLDFLRSYQASRMAVYEPPPIPMGEPVDPDQSDDVELGYELDPENWKVLPSSVWNGWRANEWEERPVCFVDGKDVGGTIAWVRAPGGYPIPVRLSEIGATVVRVDAGVCQREHAEVERVVSMTVDPFPWDEVEGFAEALQQNNFRLLPATPPGGELSYDFETMRKAAQNRSNTEMGNLEEAMVARVGAEPTIIDGRLEPRRGGLDPGSPAIGVIKTIREIYLHPLGMQLLYNLSPGERTPLFSLPNAKLPVVSWYVRLTGERGMMPTWGIIRVEVLKSWFEKRTPPGVRDLDFVNCLSRFLCDYRCRDAGYARAAVSLHPVVRAEELLGALFAPRSWLMQHFYRLASL